MELKLKSLSFSGEAFFILAEIASATSQLAKRRAHRFNVAVNAKEYSSVLAGTDATSENSAAEVLVGLAAAVFVDAVARAVESKRRRTRRATVLLDACHTTCDTRCAANTKAA